MWKLRVKLPPGAERAPGTTHRFTKEQVVRQDKCPDLAAGEIFQGIVGVEETGDESVVMKYVEKILIDVIDPSAPVAVTQQPTESDEDVVTRLQDEGLITPSEGQRINRRLGRRDSEE